MCSPDSSARARTHETPANAGTPPQMPRQIALAFCHGRCTFRVHGDQGAPGLLSAAEREFAQALSRLAYCNPFLPERIAAERAALGGDFSDRDRVWNVRVDRESCTPTWSA